MGRIGRPAAVRLIGVTFFALAFYLVAQSIHDLAGHGLPGNPYRGWP